MYGTSAELVLYLIFYNTKMTVVRIKTSFRNKLTSVGVSCCYVLFICHRLLKEKVRVIDSPKNWAWASLSKLGGLVERKVLYNQCCGAVPFWPGSGSS